MRVWRNLADAQGLGPCGSDPVEVQILSPALRKPTERLFAEWVIAAKLQPNTTCQLPLQRRGCQEESRWASRSESVRFPTRQPPITEIMARRLTVVSFPSWKPDKKAEQIAARVLDLEVFESPRPFPRFLYQLMARPLDPATQGF